MPPQKNVVQWPHGLCVNVFHCILECGCPGDFTHCLFSTSSGAILREMATRKIVKADVAKGGTQLKMLLMLEGGQQVLFKPQW